MRLFRAILFVKDLPRMAAFYENTLGLTPNTETRTTEWVEFDAEGTTFALHAIPEEFAKGIRTSSPPTAREQAPTKLCFFVADLPAVRSRLEAAGVTFLDRPWGSVDALDPEGNVFQLCTLGSP
jgi:catechol 2,3-dioxygenase-like lactoylglutathione lyase family enzyme